MGQHIPATVHWLICPYQQPAFPGPLLAHHGARDQQDFFDPYSPLFHSTFSVTGSANSHLSYDPSSPCTSVPSMPTLTHISLPIDAMPNTGTIYLSNCAQPHKSIPTASFPRTAMYNTGSTYPNNCARPQMSIPPVNMASAGIAVTGMTTPPSTLKSS